MNKLGLTEEQVLKSRQEYGDNRLSEVKSEGFWEKLKGNFGDPMIKILCVALIINIVFAFLGQTEWYESVGIAFKNCKMKPLKSNVKYIEMAKLQKFLLMTL